MQQFVALLFFIGEEMNKFKTPKIICPSCGAQYLPCEIYLPNSFLGKTKMIEKDVYGKILDYYGSSMDLKEQYKCDKCNTTFSVKATVTFNTQVKSEFDFDSPYVSNLRSTKLTLSEK